MLLNVKAIVDRDICKLFFDSFPFVIAKIKLKKL